MITWGETQAVPLADIAKPDDWQTRLRAPHVRALAESIRRTNGPIAPPVVHELTNEVIAGADRLAAHELLGESEVLVRWVNGTPAELSMLTAAENARRRQDADDWLVRLVEAERALLEETERFTGQTARQIRRGRQKTIIGEARERVAEVTGKTPEAVRSAEKRVKAKREAEEAPPVPEPEPEAAPEPPIRTLGIEAAHAAFPRAVDVQAAIDNADKALRSAGAFLKPLLDKALLPSQTAKRLREEVRSVARLVREARPACVCPQCRLAPEKLGSCAYCDGLGWIGEGTLALTPPDMLKDEEPEAF